MNIITATRTKIVLQPTRKDESWTSFVFDVGIIPDKPTPKKIVIQKHVNGWLCSWSMTWRKFLRQTCVGNVIILHKTDFAYQSKWVGKKK